MRNVIIDLIEKLIIPKYDSISCGVVYTNDIYKLDRKSTRLNSSHIPLSRMPSSA